MDTSCAAGSDHNTLQNAFEAIMNAQPEPGASLSLDLDGTVRILGDGASTTTINGDGIRNAGTVTLDQVVVSDSHASD